MLLIFHKHVQSTMRYKIKCKALFFYLNNCRQQPANILELCKQLPLVCVNFTCKAKAGTAIICWLCQQYSAGKAKAGTAKAIYELRKLAKHKQQQLLCISFSSRQSLRNADLSAF